MRELAVLDPPLARRYLEAVAVVAPRIEARLSDRVFANRVASSSADPPAIRLASWRAERRAFGARLRCLARAEGSVVLADVRDCYGSIRPGVVRASLERLGCDRGAARDVAVVLERIDEAGRPGLPVGPAASAVLANAVLSPIDEALASAGIRHLRWVDDVVALVLGSGAPDVVLELLSAALGGVGLELNATKTRVMAPGEIARDRGVAISRAGPSLG